MFDPKVKVYKPSEKSHDLDFSSILTSNFGEMRCILNKHIFTGEGFHVGIEWLQKFVAMLSPAFQRYDIRFDAFIIPEDTHFKDVLKYYKVGGRPSNIPAACLNPFSLYLAVALDSIYTVGLDSQKYNPFSGTLLDDFNCPTFDDILDSIRSTFAFGAGHDADLITIAHDWFGVDIDDASHLDMTSNDGLPAKYLYTLTFWTKGVTLRHNLIVNLFLHSIFFGEDFSKTAVVHSQPTYIDFTKSPLWALHECDKDITLLPFLSYQALWREYYRNSWVDDADAGDNGIESFGYVPYLPTDVDVLDIIPFFEVGVSSVSSVFRMISVDKSEVLFPLDVDFWFGDAPGNKPVPGAAWIINDNNQVVRNRIHYVVGSHDVNFVNDYFTSASLVSDGENRVSIPLTSSLFASNSNPSAATPIYAPSGGGEPVVRTSDIIRGRVSVINNGTIPDLRIANVMQIIEEKSALAASNRPYEFYKLFFGHIIPDARLHRPQFLRRIKRYASIQEVTQTGMSSEGQPLGDVAGKASSVFGDSFFRVVADEPSWIQVIMSVVPKQAYFQGLPIEMCKTDPFDYLIPDFQHVGMRSIDSSEIYVGLNTTEELDAPFGFTDIYNEYRCSLDEVHGEFRSSMAYWTSNRRFSSMPRLNKDFIRVNSKDPELYKPFAVTSGYTSHILTQIYFHIKAIRPLDVYPVYSL